MRRIPMNLFFLSILLFITILAAPAQADAPLAGQLRSQPCSGGWRIVASYPPSATCWGWNQTVANTTLIPVPRAYHIAPEYPLVGLVTALGVDWDPASFGVARNQTDIFRPNSEWFVNYRVEIQISSHKQKGGVFNPVTGTNRIYELADHFPQVSWGYENTYLSACPYYSLETVSLDKGGNNGCRSPDVIQGQLGHPFSFDNGSNGPYDLSAGAPDWLWLGSQISSKSGSAQQYGEPAFGMRVTTNWTVWARSNWDHYYRWQCHDVPVIDPVTGKPVIDPVTGKPVTRQVCGWENGGGGGDWVYLGQVTLGYIVVPGQGPQPLYPVPVFQSQPLLSTP